MKLAVVVPVHNGGENLYVCLKALRRSSRQADEILVVDDASDDGVARNAARHFQCDLLRSNRTTPSGPAVARNRGANSVSANTDIVIFIDPDVVVGRHTLQQIEMQFLATPHVDALFGSYNDQPTGHWWIGRYKSLLQQHYLHTNHIQSSTFWAGCGAIRLSVLNQVGGFDERYHFPAIEDIELGARLRLQGITIMRCPHILVTDARRWSLSKMIRSDFHRHFRPLKQLLSANPELLQTLQATTRDRVSAVIALLLAIVILALPFTFKALPMAVGLIAAFFAFEYPVFSYFARKKGWLIALSLMPLHLISNWCSSAASAYAMVSGSAKSTFVTKSHNLNSSQLPAPINQTARVDP